MLSLRLSDFGAVQIGSEKRYRFIHEPANRVGSQQIYFIHGRKANFLRDQDRDHPSELEATFHCVVFCAQGGFEFPGPQDPLPDEAYDATGKIKPEFMKSVVRRSYPEKVYFSLHRVESDPWKFCDYSIRCGTS